MLVKHTFPLGDHTVALDTGGIGRQVTGAVGLEMSASVPLATVVAAREPMSGCTFLPLAVDYVEKAYAGGRNPGSVLRREWAVREGNTHLASDRQGDSSHSRSGRGEAHFLEHES